MHIGDDAFSGCSSLYAVYLPPTITHIGDQAFFDCKSLRCFYVPEPIEDVGACVFRGCNFILQEYEDEEAEDEEIQPFKSFNFEEDDEDECDEDDDDDDDDDDEEDEEDDEDDDEYGSDEVIQWLMQLHAYSPFHRACSSTSANPQGIGVCFQDHGVERATEVDDQQMTALHILCANPHVTGDCIRAYLQLAPEAADRQDREGMTPFQYLCRNDINFLEEALWYGCMP